MSLQPNLLCPWAIGFLQPINQPALGLTSSSCQKIPVRLLRVLQIQNWVATKVPEAEMVHYLAALTR